jgi:LysR family transcriptional regulator, regulator for metE and metH
MFNIDVQHLVVLRAIEEEGSMTKAALRLRLSQSALSHHLRTLERNIGTALFDRRNKKLWLTDAGREMLKSSAVIVAELDRLQHTLTGITTGDSGVIRISTQCYTAYHWLARLLSQFSKKYPKIDVRIITEATRKPLQYLEEGKLDIAIVNTKGGQSPGLGKELSVFPLFQDELVVVLSKKHPLAGKKVITPGDLEGQTLLTYDAHDKDLDLVNLLLRPKGIKPRGIIKMALTEVIVEMIRCDMGISVMARWLAEPMLDKKIVVRQFGDPYSLRTWHCVTRGRQTAIQQKFIDLAVAELGKT